MGKNVHVTRRAGGQWAVVSEGASRASGLYETQGRAIDAGRSIARNHRSELVIHDRENHIRDKDSYGNDRCPPHDKR